MVKSKNKHNLWKRLHFKYRISIINENTLEETGKIKISMFSSLISLIFFALFFIFVTSIIIITTPIRYYLPGYMDASIREKAVSTAISVDSLETQMRYQEAYINNIKNIFSGDISPDSITLRGDTIAIDENDSSLMKSAAERKFVSRFEEDERYNLSVLPASTNGPATDGIAFFRPVEGLVVPDSVLHRQLGVGLSVAPSSALKSVQEGTVVYTGYDISSGTILQIQHKNGFLSVYKGNFTPLKEVGASLAANEAIGVMKGEKGEAQKLFFELWYRGAVVNPKDYISF